MLANKRGQELSMSTIVIIILAILVLAIVALIFLGGTTGLNQRLKSIFLPQQAIAVDLAIQTCNQWCSLGETASNPQNSAFCKSYQTGVDKDRDGNPDRDKGNEGSLIRYYCSKNAYDTNANLADDIMDSHLDVGCSIDCSA